MVTKKSSSLAFFLLLTACVAMSLVLTTPAWGQATQTQVDLSSSYNVSGIYTDGTTFSGGLDGGGAAYSENAMAAGAPPNGSAPSYPTLSLVQGSNTIVFNFGPANALDVVSGAGIGPVALPQGQFTTLQMLGTGVQGGQQGSVVVTYTDASTTTVSQGFSDWFSTGPYNTGESLALDMPYRDNGDGTKDNRHFHLFAYNLVVDPSKTVQSLTLPNNRNIVILAVTLVAVPGYITAAGTPNPTSIKAGSSSTIQVTVTSEAGYSGMVTLGCLVSPTIISNGAEKAPTCSFTPSTSTIAPGTPGSASLSFTTFAPSGTSGAILHPSHIFYALWLPIPGIAVMGFGCRTQRRRMLWTLLLLVMLLTALIATPSCVSYKHLGNVGTPPGPYTIAITGTDANNVTQFGSGGTVVVNVN